MKLGEIAASVGKGLFAGVAGTAAMTVSSTLEMKIRDRQVSNTPAEAASKVLGVDEPTGSRNRPASRTWSTGATERRGAQSEGSSTRPASKERRPRRRTSWPCGARSRSCFRP